MQPFPVYTDVCGAQEYFPSNSCPVSPACSVPDRQRPDPHPRHGEPAHRHPVHHGGGALPAGGAHLLQPAWHAPLPDQRDPAPPPHAGRGAVRGLQPGLRMMRRADLSAVVLMHFNSNTPPCQCQQSVTAGDTGKSLSLYMLLQDC